MESNSLLNLLTEILSSLNISNSTNLIKCSVFENISYFMIYLCCGKLYCCDTCHNKSEGHIAMNSGYMLCNDCEGIQPLRNEPNNCECCGSFHPALIKKRTGSKSILACQIYSNISYWMLFDCCKNLYCCITCHQADQGHDAPKCQKMVCFDCGSTQTMRNEPNNCEVCKSHHPALTRGASTVNPQGSIRCSVYGNISYFMLFPCCGNLYCCNCCHNNTETHQPQACKEMVCFSCGGKQPLKNEPNVCQICNVSHPALVAKAPATSVKSVVSAKKRTLLCTKFKNASYWMVFPCCNNLYCCFNCHNADQSHSATNSNEMICFDCGAKQVLRYEPNNCSHCHSFHPALAAGTLTRSPSCNLPCSTFSNISYFMVFPCCNRLYCCDVCHNNKETHKGQKCLEMVCFFCGGKQPLRNEPNKCSICDRNHPKLLPSRINIS